ncbi:hypothetical protein BV898_15518 [Hypsibius exemplaris]|uniref:Uncharacterized protein n=1 Tax=Hypsibius exemplaris TaxID=2072580 RepID=A0A9X6NE33_HYPEX|nr:hypothetical protein BV898_15518 [Hypsibius exemplaris]
MLKVFSLLVVLSFLLGTLQSGNAQAPTNNCGCPNIEACSRQCRNRGYTRGTCYGTSASSLTCGCFNPSAWLIPIYC